MQHAQATLYHTAERGGVERCNKLDISADRHHTLSCYQKTLSGKSETVTPEREKETLSYKSEQVNTEREKETVEQRNNQVKRLPGVTVTHELLPEALSSKSEYIAIERAA
jgi:hypothetical protein